MSEQEAKSVEIWLTLDEDGSGVYGRMYFDDETTRPIPVRARSIGGAEREVTAWLIGQGYEAVSYWNVEAGDDELVTESSRTFRGAAPVAGMPQLT